MIKFAPLLIATGVVFITLPALAEQPAGGVQAGVGAAIAPATNNGLGRVHGGLAADSARGAGQSREVVMSATNVASGKPLRPAPTPRAMKRMTPERAIASSEAGLRDCATSGGGTTPTTLGLRLAVAPTGEVESAELAMPTRVAAPLLACVIKVVSAARFGSPGPSGASVVIPFLVPARAAVAEAAPAATEPATTDALAAKPVAAVVVAAKE